MANEQVQMSFMTPRADLKPEIFDTLITQKGYKVIWEQGMFCSCYIQDSGQPDYNCPACKGKGYVYFSPTPTRVLVTSISGRKEQEHTGLNELGTAYMTPLSKDEVGFRDRFTFLDFTMKYSQLITRGAPSRPDRLTYEAKDIVALRHLTDVYKRGVDFNLSKDGWQIEWITQPFAEGTRYSILYLTAPVYIAINPIHELRGTYTMFKQGGHEQFVQLPKQFQIKREDFIEDGRIGNP